EGFIGGSAGIRIMATAKRDQRKYTLAEETRHGLDIFMRPEGLGLLHLAGGEAQFIQSQQVQGIPRQANDTMIGVINPLGTQRQAVEHLRPAPKLPLKIAEEANHILGIFPAAFV